MNGRRIRLSNGRFAIVDSDDYERVVGFKWYFSTGYAKRKAAGRILQLSNFIMGVPIGVIVDHRSRNRLDNRRSNLRIATRGQNNCNTEIRRDNKSGFKGVHWDKESRKWRTEIECNNKGIFLGRFHDKLKAAAAYVEAAKRLHGEFANV